MDNTDRKQISPLVKRVAIMTAAAFFMLLLAGLAWWIGQPLPTTGDSGIGKDVDASAGIIYTSSFPDLEGRQQSLGQWQKKLLIINFWATWCGPCKEEMPIFAKLQQKYAANGLQIVGIASDSTSNVINFVKHTPMPYPLLPDETRAMAFSSRLGNRLALLPHTVVVRPGGEVIQIKIGPIHEAEYEAMILKNLPK